MIKYVSAQVTFAEVPDEINLCFSISNCGGSCKNCHSPELRQDIGTPLLTHICKEINSHFGITCICFLGESLKSVNAVEEWKYILHYVRNYFPELKLALYSGRDNWPTDKELLDMLDYIKIGSYQKDLGGLKCITTNQRMYKKTNGEWKDITERFWTSSIK